MPGPPEDVPASELFLKLQETPAPTEVVNFPRKTSDGKPIGTTRIRVLRGEDQEAARNRAKEYLKAKFKMTNEDLAVQPGASLLGDATAREILAMACLTEKSHGGEAQGAPYYPLVFPNADAIGKLLSTDETAVLFQCYLLVQAKYGPFERNVQTEQDLSAWIKRLVEGAAEFPLRQLSSVQWAELASFLAQRAHTLSVILECLLPSLPPTLASRLATYSLGTGFFGRRASSTSTGSDGTETSASELKVSDIPITIEDAREMAAAMKVAEESVLAELDEAERNREL
ncbi:MAG TPA: hypothetical protein VFW03_26590 [Gemmatimonadaceae bacterium]|nr:hypothetical protein [Gemmatimonadaceae bacterium]